MVLKCNPLTCEWCCGRIPQRVVLAIMLHLALQNSYSIRVVLNIAIVEMIEPEVKNISTNPCPQFETLSRETKGGQFPWPQKTRSQVLYAFFIGYVFSGAPSGWLADKFGGRLLLGVCVFSSAFANVLFPLLTQKFGYISAVVLRAVLGLVQGTVLPIISSFVSTWIPPKERQLLGGISYGGSNLGTIVGSIFTGFIIDYSNSWPVAFYFWSSVSFGYVFFLHTFLVFSYPHTHPFISESELKYLTETIAPKRKLKTPWKAIMTNIPFWANIFAQFGHNYIFFMMNTWLPSYMKDILQYDIKNNGLVSSIPSMALWISSLVLSFSGHYLVNGLKFMTPQMFSKVFGTFSNIFSSLLVVAAVYVGCNRELCLTLYTVGMITKAFYYMTLPVNINELSKNFGGMMFGIANSIGGFAGLLGSAIIGYIVRDNTFTEWKTAFWITVGVEVLTSIVYILWSSSDRQPFDYQDDELPPEKET